MYDGLRGSLLAGEISRGRLREVEVETEIESSDQGPECVSILTILNHCPGKRCPLYCDVP